MSTLRCCFSYDNPVEDLTVALEDEEKTAHLKKSWKEEGKVERLDGNDSSVNDMQFGFIVFSGMIYFMALAMSVLSVKFTINKQFAGDVDEVNRKSAFVDTTVSFLYAASSLFSAKYCAALSDYLGRRPVNILSCFGNICSRLLYLQAKTPAEYFVGAVVSGIFDSYYFTSLAMISDIYPDRSVRTKCIGIYNGLLGGTALTIGLPLGIALAFTVGIMVPLKVSIGMNVVCIVMNLLMRVDDLKGVVTDETKIMYIFGRRGLPRQLWPFLVDNFCISSNTWVVFNEAENILDWITHSCVQIAGTVVNILFIPYCLTVLHFTALGAALSILSLGILTPLAAGVLLSLFVAESANFYAALLYAVGLLLFSIAGFGIDNPLTLAIPALVLISVGHLTIPCMQALITKQYSPLMQGIVAGLLNQQHKLAYVPAYLISLLFSFSLRTKGDDGNVFWPGSAFFVVSCIVVIASMVHYKSYGREKVLTLLWRVDKVLPSADEPVQSAIAPGCMIIKAADDQPVHIISDSSEPAMDAIEMVHPVIDIDDMRAQIVVNDTNN